MWAGHIPRRAKWSLRPKNTRMATTYQKILTRSKETTWWRVRESVECVLRYRWWWPMCSSGCLSSAMMIDEASECYQEVWSRGLQLVVWQKTSMYPCVNEVENTLHKIWGNKTITEYLLVGNFIKIGTMRLFTKIIEWFL